MGEEVRGVFCLEFYMVYYFSISFTFICIFLVLVLISHFLVLFLVKYFCCSIIYLFIFCVMLHAMFCVCCVFHYIILLEILF